MTLKEIRISRGYFTARQFAESIDIPYQTYLLYEQDPMRMPLHRAAIIARALYTTIDAIAGETEDPISLMNWLYTDKSVRVLEDIHG